MNSISSFCSELSAVLRLVGFVKIGIQIGVPIILIVVGMIDFAKAVAAKDEGEIKKAQNGLIKKAIAAVLVFFVMTIVSLLMTIIGYNQGDLDSCLSCVKNPFGGDCAKPEF